MKEEITYKGSAYLGQNSGELHLNGKDIVGVKEIGEWLSQELNHPRGNIDFNIEIKITNIH